MAVIVETGAGLSNATSYVSEAELLAYATARGKTLSTDRSVLLIQAMDYIDEQDFIGEKFTETQALQWPRYNAWLDNYLIGPDTIPQLLKDCLCEAAIAVDAGNSPLATIEREVKRETVDVLTIEYMDSAGAVPYNRALETKLRRLIKGGGKKMVVRA